MVTRLDQITDLPSAVLVTAGVAYNATPVIATVLGLVTGQVNLRSAFPVNKDFAVFNQFLHLLVC